MLLILKLLILLLHGRARVNDYTIVMSIIQRYRMMQSLQTVDKLPKDGKLTDATAQCIIQTTEDIIYTGVNMQQEAIIKPHNFIYSNKTSSYNGSLLV